MQMQKIRFTTITEVVISPVCRSLNSDLEGKELFDKLKERDLFHLEFLRDLREACILTGLLIEATVVDELIREIACSVVGWHDHH